MSTSLSAGARLSFHSPGPTTRTIKTTSPNECRIAIGGSGVMSKSRPFFHDGAQIAGPKAGNNCKDCHQQPFVSISQGRGIEPDLTTKVVRRQEGNTCPGRSVRFYLHPFHQGGGQPQTAIACA